MKFLEASDVRLTCLINITYLLTSKSWLDFSGAPGSRYVRLGLGLQLPWLMFGSVRALVMPPPP